MHDSIWHTTIVLPQIVRKKSQKFDIGPMLGTEIVALYDDRNLQKKGEML